MCITISCRYDTRSLPFTYSLAKNSLASKSLFAMHLL